jgi:hypothetical protein
MRLRWLSCGLVLLGAAACSDSGDEGGLEGSGGSINAGTGGTTGGGAAIPGATPGGSSLGAGGIAGPGGGITGGGLGVTGGGTTGGSLPGGTAGGTGNGLPCEVATIFKDKCSTCHGNPLMSGPMPLITWQDLQAISTTVPGAKIADRVKARINDMAKPMPPPARPQLTAQEKQMLLAYLNAGAQRSTATCNTGGSAELGGPGGPGGGTTGGTAGGTGGTGYNPPDTECDYIQEFRAHGAQAPGDTTPFTPPQGGDNYEMFYFKPKWNEKVHVIRIDPITDNAKVLHHWLLYMEEGVGSGDGTHQPDIGLQSPTAQLLSGWAPGNDGLPLTREIGLQVVTGPNSRLGIEIHYNTNSYPAIRADRSGARLCLTKTLRPKEATVHWLGTQAVVGLGLGVPSEAYGVCSVQTESHIIAHSPHMHTMGRHMKTVITKRAGGTVTITDQPFDFNDQQIFPIKNETGEIVVGPGDVIDTTCTFDGGGFFTFGPATDQEMCYNFVLAYPPGSLSNGVPGIVGGQNTCIDGI